MDDFTRLNLIGTSRAFMGVLSSVRKFSGCNATVLINGETGTGKELVARAIHYLGPRRDLPFIPVNCGALPDSLVESEFFGHVRGAFTDAREARRGFVTEAHGGTLFLDELEAMSPRAQVALLRFLQDKEYRPLGGPIVKNADVRVIGATNADLSLLVKAGHFRADLLFRLEVLPLHVPPLRHRPGDAIILADCFIARLNQLSGVTCKVLHSGSAGRLDAYSWPGNVRELENLIQREFVLSGEESVVQLTTLPPGDDDAVPPSSSRVPTSEEFKTAKARAVAAFEKAYLVALLSKTEGNVSLAARVAGKDRSDICRLLKKYGLERQQFADTHEP